MKVVPVWVSKRHLLSKLAKRNDRVIKLCTTVSPNITSDTKNIIMPLIDSLARFGSKKWFIFNFGSVSKANDMIEITAYTARSSINDKNIITAVKDKNVMQVAIKPDDNLYEISSNIKKNLKDIR